MNDPKKAVPKISVTIKMARNLRQHIPPDAQLQEVSTVGQAIVVADAGAVYSPTGSATGRIKSSIRWGR